ncbi:MAG: hypothetical protein R3Y26_10360 [Rikenellaceae bacterium]
MKQRKNHLLLTFDSIMLCSCTSSKEISYLQGIPESFEQTVNESYGIKIQPDDLISIMVNNHDHKLTQMFNMPMDTMVYVTK